jgi:hypothetical protein
LSAPVGPLDKGVDRLDELIVTSGLENCSPTLCKATSSGKFPHARANFLSLCQAGLHVTVAGGKFPVIEVSYQRVLVIFYQLYAERLSLTEATASPQGGHHGLVAI